VQATYLLQVIPVESDLTEFKKEIDILARCSSNYIVEYIGSYLKEGDLWIVMEYCGAGSVADLMAICDATLMEEEIAEVLAAALKGLEYLHSIKLIHRGGCPPYSIFE
jgi:serine/threonine protein kinase